MSDKIDDLIKSFARFEGNTSAKLKNIETQITEMKNDRKDTAEKLWENINSMNEKITDKHEEVNKEMSRIKIRVAGMSAAITTVVTIGVGWVRSKF